MVLRRAVDQPNRWAFRCRANVNGRELLFAGRLVNCSRWMDLRPRNSSSPAWSLFLLPTVFQCQRTVGVACQQWQRLPDSRPPNASAPIHVGTCKLSSPACTWFSDGLEASEVHEAPAWCGRTFTLLSLPEQLRSERLTASSACRHWHRTASCCSNQGGCLWRHVQVSLQCQTSATTWLVGVDVAARSKTDIQLICGLLWSAGCPEENPRSWTVDEKVTWQTAEIARWLKACRVVVFRRTRVCSLWKVLQRKLLTEKLTQVRIQDSRPLSRREWTNTFELYSGVEGRVPLYNSEYAILVIYNQLDALCLLFTERRQFQKQRKYSKQGSKVIWQKPHRRLVTPRGWSPSNACFLDLQ